MLLRMIMPAFLLAAMTAASGGAAAPPSKAQPRPAQFQRLVDCRGVADQGQRLACYDREAAAIEQAQVSGQLVVMDNQQVRRTRRSLFGLAIPDLGVFGDNSDEDRSELQTTIKAVRQDPRGKWTFDLAEGGRWVQLDTRRFITDPAPGQPVRIRRAALGSYLANVNKQLAVRVQRVN